MKSLRSKLVGLLASGFLLFFNHSARAEDKIRLSAGYSSLSLENKFDSDENGSYDGGVFNRISLGCYRNVEGHLVGQKTKGVQYDLIFAFGESRFVNKNEATSLKRDFFGIWPAVSYRFDDGKIPYFRLGFGAIPLAQISNYYPGETHHANYFGLEGIFGLDFESGKAPVGVSFIFTYGYVKKSWQSANKIRDTYRLPDNMGFFSLGFSVSDKNLF